MFFFFGYRGDSLHFTSLDFISLMDIKKEWAIDFIKLLFRRPSMFYRQTDARTGKRHKG